MRWDPRTAALLVAVTVGLAACSAPHAKGSYSGTGGLNAVPGVSPSPPPIRPPEQGNGQGQGNGQAQQNGQGARAPSGHATTSQHPSTATSGGVRVGATLKLVDDYKIESQGNCDFRLDNHLNQTVVAFFDIRHTGVLPLHEVTWSEYDSAYGGHASGIAPPNYFDTGGLYSFQVVVGGSPDETFNGKVVDMELVLNTGGPDSDPNDNELDLAVSVTTQVPTDGKTVGVPCNLL